MLEQIRDRQKISTGELLTTKDKLEILRTIMKGGTHRTFHRNVRKMTAAFSDMKSWTTCGDIHDALEKERLPLRIL